MDPAIAQLLQPRAPDYGARRNKNFVQRKPLPSKLANPCKIPPAPNRHNPALPLPRIQERDLEKGVFSLINRGFIPNTADVTTALEGLAGVAPLSCEPSVVHPVREVFNKKDIMTNYDHGISQVMNVKLDLTPVVHSKPASRPAGVVRVTARAAKPTTPVEDTALTDKERENTRTYEELLDYYSLHEFIIRQGKTIEATPEFQSFQRSFSHKWGAIVSIIRALEQLLDDYSVPKAFIDGKKVAALADKGAMNCTQEDLLNCISDQTDISAFSKTRKFHTGKKGFAAAATKIQSVVRMYFQRLRYIQMKESNVAAVKIQMGWRIHRQHTQTRNKIRQKAMEAENHWRLLMDQFIQNWHIIRESPRLVIHIPSLSMPLEQCKTTPYYNCYQNTQMMRLCDIADPNVTVLYVSPFPVEQEVASYYVKLLQVGGVRNPQDRIIFMYPEIYDRMNSSSEPMSLTKMILWSQKLIRMIKQQARGRIAYIVPRVMGPEELSLAIQLQIPLLAAEPTAAPLYSCKSAAKRVFEASDVLTPIGAYDVHSDEELFSILSRFVVCYPEYPRWVIKIDNDTGGRGLAYIDVHRLRAMQHVDLSAVPVEDVIKSVYEELTEMMHKRVRIMTGWLYSSWSAFLKDFCTMGGVIEAVPPNCISSPTAHLFVHPNGEIEVCSIQEQVLSPQYCCVGCSFPQTSVPHNALKEAALSIGKVCHTRKILGYCSIDFVVFRKENQLRLWALDLDIGMTDNFLAHRWASFICMARPGEDTAQRLPCVPYPGSEASDRVYLFVSIIYHPYLPTIRHNQFFNLCKQKGISFDLQERVGVLFNLVDTLLKGCIGIISIGKTRHDAIAYAWAFIEFLQQQLYNSGADETQTNFTNILSACRLLYQTSITIMNEEKKKEEARK